MNSQLSFLSCSQSVLLKGKIGCSRMKPKKIPNGGLLRTFLCLWLVSEVCSTTHVQSVGELGMGSRKEARVECLAKLICGLNVGEGELRSKQTHIITNFFRDKMSAGATEEMVKAALEDYYERTERLQTSFGGRKKRSEDREKSRTSFFDSTLTTNRNSSLLRGQHFRNQGSIGRALQILENYSRGGRSETTLKDCEQIPGCPTSFQKLKRKYGGTSSGLSSSELGLFSQGEADDEVYDEEQNFDEFQSGVKTKSPPGASAAWGSQSQGVKGEGGEVVEKHKQLWLRPRPRPPPPPFWQVKTPPDFWESRFPGGGWEGGRGKKGKKGGKGKKGKKGKGKKGNKRCRKGKGKGKGKKGKKGGDCGPTSSEEERKFHARLQYFLAEQQRINVHKAGLSWRIGGRPMALEEHKDVPVRMSFSPSYTGWRRPLEHAISTLGGVLGQHSGVLYHAGNEDRNSWSHG